MDDIEILEQQAIDAAINLQWDQAVEFNKKILRVDKENVDSCLRLGFAFMRQKNFEEAKKYYTKSLRLRPKNQVALENLERLALMEGSSYKKDKNRLHASLNPSMFLEVPGKTKTVSLVNLGQKKHLAGVSVGQEVELKQKKRKIEVRTLNNEHLGSLPDDLSKRLIFFLKAKSVYKAYVQEASLTRIVIFIKEESKGKKVTHYTSFPANIQTNLDQMENPNQAPEIPETEEPTEEDEADELETLAEKITDRDEDTAMLSEIGAAENDEDAQEEE